MIKRFLIALSVIGALLMPVAPVAAASPLEQFGSACPGAMPFLTFRNWYAGLNCVNGAPDLSKSASGQDLGLNGIWVVALTIIDDIIMATGFIAVGFVIWGGIKFMKSQGDPGQLTDARNVIINALIGLGIVLASVALVSFVTASL